MNGNISIIQLLWQAHPLVKVVLALLLAASVLVGLVTQPD